MISGWVLGGGGNFQTKRQIDLWNQNIVISASLHKKALKHILIMITDI